MIRHVPSGRQQASGWVHSEPGPCGTHSFWAVTDEGAVYCGKKAWLMVLWITYDHRMKALRLVAAGAVHRSIDVLFNLSIAILLLVANAFSLISAGTELANYTGKDADVFVPGSWCAYPWRSGYANVGIVRAVGSGVDP